MAELKTKKTKASHIKRLSDVHLPTLTKLIAASVKHVQKTYKN